MNKRLQVPGASDIASLTRIQRTCSRIEIQSFFEGECSLSEEGREKHILMQKESQVLRLFDFSLEFV